MPEDFVAQVILGLLVAGILYSMIEWHVLWKSERRGSAVVSGVEAFIGRDAEVIEPFQRSFATSPLIGRVRIDGESWRAELGDQAAAELQRGDMVRIVAVDHGVLRVSRL